MSATDAISATEAMSPMYRTAMAVVKPIMRGWGRLEVSGLEQLPLAGPVLLAGNHDSWWDPVAVGVAARPRRQVRALAKSDLWKVPGLAPVLDGMGQIPIERGKQDLVALARAAGELRAGACIGIFLEGTRSRGRVLRARSGIGRLAQQVPEAELLCVSIVGTADLARFPTRPRLRVRFFRPEEGSLRPGESPSEFGARLLADIRREAPVAVPGRRGRRAASPAPPPAAEIAPAGDAVGARD